MKSRTRLLELTLIFRSSNHKQASTSSGETISDESQVYRNGVVSLTIETVSYIAFGGVLPTVGQLIIRRVDDVPEGYKVILEKVIEDVKQRLKDRPECKKLLGNLNIEDILNNRTSVGPRDPEGRKFEEDGVAAISMWDMDADGSRLASGSLVVNSLNTSPFYFSGMAARSLGIRGRRMNQHQLRQLVLIHELVHLGDTAGKYDDMIVIINGIGQPNSVLNRLIAKECF